MPLVEFTAGAAVLIGLLAPLAALGLLVIILVAIAAAQPRCPDPGSDEQARRVRPGPPRYLMLPKQLRDGRAASMFDGRSAAPPGSGDHSALSEVAGCN